MLVGLDGRTVVMELEIRYGVRTNSPADVTRPGDLAGALELELEVLLGLDAVLHEPPVRDAPVGADGPEVQPLVGRRRPAHFPDLPRPANRDFGTKRIFFSPG